VRNHNQEQIMHGLFPKRVADAVLDAIGDNESLSVPILDNAETGRQFALLILQLLAARGSGHDISADSSG
jgi:type I restriction enzyme R subunit